MGGGWAGKHSLQVYSTDPPPHLGIPPPLLCSFPRLPFYYELKMAFVLWLLSPYTRGAGLLYRRFVHPTLSRKEKVGAHNLGGGHKAASPPPPFRS